MVLNLLQTKLQNRVNQPRKRDENAFGRTVVRVAGARLMHVRERRLRCQARAGFYLFPLLGCQVSSLN